MEFTYDIMITLSILVIALGFFFGWLREFIKCRKLEDRPLTYYELTGLPDGTKVLLLQYECKEQGWVGKEHGEIYTRKNGSKAIDVYDGDIELTEADVWLDEQ